VGTGMVCAGCCTLPVGWATGAGVVAGVGVGTLSEAPARFDFNNML